MKFFFIILGIIGLIYFFGNKGKDDDFTSPPYINWSNYAEYEDKAPVQALVIKELEKGPMFQKELTEVLKKDKSQISNICSSLANDGIIHRSDRTKPWGLVESNLLT